MNTLTIHNPATGERITTLPADDAASVAAKATAARAAQPAWAVLPIADRLDIVRRFRATLVEQVETLAQTLTQEMGKPISQARSEINGLLPRIDFFMEQIGRASCRERVWNCV